MQNILIYGGSFDPPHNGHINTAISVEQFFHFERFIFLPCKIPLLKQATLASAQQRICMLQLAIENHPEFSIDQREINRKTPSYMVETLQSFREEIGTHAPITLLLGMDAFIQLPKWHCFDKLLTLSHVLVIKRARISEKKIPQILKKLLITHEVFDKNDLLTCPCGKIYQYDAGQYPVSSSELRQKIRAKENIEAYLPPAVYHYIKALALYQ